MDGFSRLFIFLLLRDYRYFMLLMLESLGLCGSKFFVQILVLHTVYPKVTHAALLLQELLHLLSDKLQAYVVVVD